MLRHELVAILIEEFKMIGIESGCIAGIAAIFPVFSVDHLRHGLVISVPALLTIVFGELGQRGVAEEFALDFRDRHALRR